MCMCENISFVNIRFLCVRGTCTGAWIRDDGEDRHVPLDEYAANLKKIVEHLRALKKELRILFVNPPPVDDVRMRAVLSLEAEGESSAPWCV